MDGVTAMFGRLANGFWRQGLACGLMALVMSTAAVGEDEVIRLASGTEIASERYAASGPALVVWITGQHGRVEEERKAAADMAAQGVETWLTDFFVPYFLPLVASSWSQVPDADLAEWLESLRQRHPGRRIVLVSAGRGATLALRAVRAQASLRSNPAFAEAGAFPDLPIRLSDSSLYFRHAAYSAHALIRKPLHTFRGHASSPLLFCRRGGARRVRSLRPLERARGTPDARCAHGLVCG